MQIHRQQCVNYVNLLFCSLVIRFFVSIYLFTRHSVYLSVSLLSSCVLPLSLFFCFWLFLCISVISYSSHCMQFKLTGFLFHFVFVKYRMALQIIPYNDICLISDTLQNYQCSILAYILASFIFFLFHFSIT